MKQYLAKTVEDAVAAACEETGVAKDQLIYIIEEEKKGLFSKKVVINVFDLSEVIEYIDHYLVNAIGSFGITATTTINIVDDDILKVIIDSDHNSILIGKNGITLQSLNELVKLAVSNKFKRRFRILLDVNDYKHDKYRKVVSIARREAREVQKTKETVSLDPMPADERRAVHNALTRMSHVKTESEGDGKFRHITIKYIDD